MDRTRLGKVAALALLAATTAACNPVRDSHGFSAITEDQKKVEIGVDTKSTVLARLGSPSTQSAFDQAAWYYISTVQERYAFYTPRTVGREVLVVKFDTDGKVTKVDRFGMEKGQVVAYSNDHTPTRGRELGIVEQIFGNIGATSPIRNDDEQNARGGGGRRHSRAKKNAPTSGRGVLLSGRGDPNRLPCGRAPPAATARRCW